MTSELARTRLLWAIISLILPVTFGHTNDACCSLALTFSAAIHFIMKCSAVLSHSPSSRRHTIYSFPCPLPTQPAPPPPVLRTSLSRILHARLQPREQRLPPAHYHLDALIFRLHEGVLIREISSGRCGDRSFANRCSESGSCDRLGAACRSGTGAGST